MITTRDPPPTGTAAGAADAKKAGIAPGGGKRWVYPQTLSSGAGWLAMTHGIETRTDTDGAAGSATGGKTTVTAAAAAATAEQSLVDSGGFGFAIGSGKAEDKALNQLVEELASALQLKYYQILLTDKETGKRVLTAAVSGAIRRAWTMISGRLQIVFDEDQHKEVLEKFKQPQYTPLVRQYFAFIASVAAQRQTTIPNHYVSPDVRNTKGDEMTHFLYDICSYIPHLCKCMPLPKPTPVPYL